jgi:L(+)-tartrate dehydratase alpha subunit
MISKEVLEETIFNTIKQSSCCISPDVHGAFEKAIATEKAEISKKAFEGTLQSLDLCAGRESLACPDTGWPLFFIKVGEDAKVEGGMLGLEDIATRMVVKATQEGFLRKTMKHPLTGADPGDNVGMNMPNFNYKFVPGDWVQITYVAKGGGSECFGGTRYRVVAFADEITGIKKAIIDWYIAGARAGAICPPSILGVGIGGTADLCMHKAKEAACLRLIGTHHPEPMIADLEKELYEGINELGIGAMGSGGQTSVLAVNIEYSLTHLAGIAVGMSANCFIARRATTKIYDDGKIETLTNPDWFDGR